MVSSARTGGFALLVSLVVVGVVLSVGLVILDLTIKQVQLASTTRNSEEAFHAANAGMECARYWRRDQSAAVITGGDLTDISCFGQSDITVTPSTVTIDSGDGSAWAYNYEFTWGGDRCTRVTMVATTVPAGSSTAQISSGTMTGLIPGYPGVGGATCSSGSQCTTVAVRGYNQPCPSGGTFGFGVVERQVLLEF